MNVLLTKRLSPSDLDLIRSWGWNFETVETLNISLVDVKEIPKSETWVISSRNSFALVKNFTNHEPGIIYCFGNMKTLATDLAKQNLKSVLYFCGEDHRQELEEGLKNSSIKILKVITHQSQMTFPDVKNNF